MQNAITAKTNKDPGYSKIKNLYVKIVMNGGKNMKLKEILTQEEISKLEGMTEYAVPVWAINNMLRNHWKELTVDQWIELEKLYEISGLGDQIADQTNRTSKQLKRIRNAMEEING